MPKAKVVFLLTLIFASVGSSETIEKTYNFSGNDFVFTKTQGYDVIRIDGCMHICEPGFPSLPVKAVSLLIPYDAIVKDIFFEVKQETLQGTYYILPAQNPIPLINDPGIFEKIPFCPPDEETYNSKLKYPQNVIEYVTTSTKGGFKIVTLNIYPISYIPKEKKLIANSEVHLKITYEKTLTGAKTITRNQYEIFKRNLSALVENPEDIDRFSPPIVENRLSNFEYVIIAGQEAFVPEFQRLADWKTKKGVPTKIVTTNWIYGNYSGIDKQEKIRNFIIDAYNNWGTIWVLLGGQADYEWNEEYVPRRDCYYFHPIIPPFYQDQDTIPCDLYFCGLDGDWDGNNNYVYGENNDSVDIYSDVFVGRVPVKNVNQVEIFVDKVLEYEKSPPPGYLNTILLPAVRLFSFYNWWGDSVNNVIGRMVPADWNKIKLYESNGTISRPAIFNALNNGASFTHYAMHGKETSVGNEAGNILFHIDDIDTLENGYRLGIQTAISCFTGALDEVWYDESYDCFAEHFLTNPDGGAVASIMNSRFGWGAPPMGIYYSEALDTSFYSQVFKMNYYHLGEAVGAMKDACAQYVAWGATDYWAYCLYELNLFGDPEMPLWTKLPVNMTVTHNPTIPLGNSNFTVNVTDNGSPIANALVCLMMDDIVYERGTTDATGNVVIPVNAPYLGEVTITVTAHNYLPYENKIAVVGINGVYLDSCIIDDGEDNILNPNETADLYVRVKNNSAATHTVKGTLRSFDPYITISVDTTSFGAIPPNGTAISLSPFIITIGNNCPDLYSAVCTLLVNEGITQWISPFRLIIIGKCLLSINPNPLIFDYRNKFGLLGLDNPDTIYYDDGVPTKSISFSSYHSFGVRFTPVSGCTLLGALVGRNPILTNYPDKLYIRNDNSGLPGTIIDSFNYYPDKWADSGFTDVSVLNPYNPIMFETPFWITVNDQGTNNGDILGDGSGTGHSYATLDGTTWQPIESFPAGSTDLLIRAIVLNYTAISSTDTAILYLQNVGSADIVVEDIVVKNSSGWLHSINPRTGYIAKDVTLGVVVRVDTIALPHTQNYFDTLVISYTHAKVGGATYYYYVPVSILYQGTYPDVRYLSHTICDTVNGNGDGFIDPGETVDLPLWVKNYGDSIGTNIIGKFISHNQYITFIDSLATFGNIQPGDSALSDKPYRFSISALAPVGSTIPCTLYTTDGTYNWFSCINLAIGKGAIITLSIDSLVFDYTGGKDNPGLRGTIDTIFYDDGTPGSNVSTYRGYGVRFTPAGQCTVKAALVYIYSASTITQTDTFYIRADNAGKPGTIIEKIPKTLTGVLYGNWYYLPLTTTYSTSGDFWICGRRADLHYFTIDPTPNGGRSYYSNPPVDTNWYLFNGDLLFRTVVSYPSFAPPTDTGFFWVKNTGAQNLIVDSISILNNSPWFVLISPATPYSLIPAESLLSYVVIDTTGISQSQNYYDTLAFYSNAINQPSHLPVLVRFITTIVVEETNQQVFSSDFQIKPTIWTNHARICYSSTVRQHLSIKLYNIYGALIKNIFEGNSDAGNHTIDLNGSDEMGREMASGIYLCVMKSGNKEFIKKILFLH